MNGTSYNTIGKGYSSMRQADPRIAAAITEALADARSVINVGAGTGSYEPADRRVLAIEPSLTMIAQRPAGAAKCIKGCAEHLPFPDDEFDAAMALLTLHHWGDQARGMAEMKRVARYRIVILTWDPQFDRSFWLSDRYFPAIRKADRTLFPSLDQIAAWLGIELEISQVPIPHDCLDGFLGAYWRRPDAYLDPAIRAGISAFHRISAQEIAAGLEQLQADLASGEWKRRFGDLGKLEALDIGYRLLVGIPRFAAD